MGKSKSKSKSNNKKGPKGKKARAKAKLDRQWGEVQTVEETDEKSPRERGGGTTRNENNKKYRYSRLSAPQQHPQAATKITEAYAPLQVEASSAQEQERRHGGVESSDEEENEEALASFLKSIRRQSRKQRMEGSSDEDEESSHMSTDEEVNVHSNNNKNSAPPQQHDDDSEEETDDDYKTPIIKNPFTERFTRPPLSEKDDEREALLNKVHEMETIASLNPSLVWKVSKVLLDKLQLKSLTDDDDNARSMESQCRSCARSLFQFIREALQKAWRDQQRDRHHRAERIFDSMQSLIYPFLANYADLLLLTESSQQARQSSNNLLALHVLNHVWTSHCHIASHHKHQQEKQKQKHRLPMGRKEDSSPSLDDQEGDDPARDQGFTRPTVLVLLPTRGCCYSFVHLLLSLASSSALSSPSPAENADRFEAEFGPPPNEILSNNDSTHSGDNKQEEKIRQQKLQEQQRRRRQILRQKGSEWHELFGDDVNDDDDFKLGISLHYPKGGPAAAATHPRIKLFADFYKSDIILASPLGLKMIDESKKERGYDFLSSIEICYVSRADVLLMQNWDHVQDVIRLINQHPLNSTEIDFSRVRPYHLSEGQSQHWRQMIVTSSFCDPMILSFFKRYAQSISGMVTMRRRTLASDADIAKVVLPTRQVFQRVASSSLVEHASDRIRYFSETVLPEITRNKQTHTMVFIPSYFDFVSVRNLLLKREIDFVSVTEYSRVSEVSRGRARFLQGRKPILLYTGRAHFFLRHAIKGVRHLIFLGLPEYAQFYSGLVNLINEGLGEKEDSTSNSLASCLVLFTKFDGHALERIVGSNNCSRMMKGDKSTFLF